MFAVVNLVKPRQTFSRNSPKPQNQTKPYQSQTREQELGVSRKGSLHPPITPPSQAASDRNVNNSNAPEWSTSWEILPWILHLDLMIILSEAAGLPTLTWQFSRLMLITILNEVWPAGQEANQTDKSTTDRNPSRLFLAVSFHLGETLETLVSVPF